MMMAQTGKYLLLAALLLGYQAEAAPLSPADRNQVQLEQQQRLEQNQQQRDELQRSVDTRLPASPTPAGEQGGCVTVTHITIDQATLLSERDKQRLSAPYSGRCLGIAQINQITRDISQWYISRGYITSRTERGNRLINSVGSRYDHSCGTCSFARYSNGGKCYRCRCNRRFG